MQNVLNVYKPVGKTPFDMVKKIKDYFPELAKVKIGYAGRLDPMAHGVLLLLAGDANKQKIRFESLPKEYIFEAVFGIRTDSYDLLGIVSNTNTRNYLDNFKTHLLQEINNYQGTFLQTCPPYSAIRMKGKPLYYWERRGELLKELIPQNKITIHSLQLKSINSIDTKKLLWLIEKRVHAVQGNFRQEEILKKWSNSLRKNTTVFMTARFTVNCSSGTYVRSIINDLGEKLGCGATALNILRTSVGNYKLKQSLIF